MRIAFTLLTTILCSLAISRSNAAENRPARLEELTQICDLRPGAPISDLCYGFVGAIIEEKIVEAGYRPPHTIRVCVPVHMSVTEIVEALRPALYKHSLDPVCRGMCNALSDISNALIGAYKCEEPPN